MTLQADCQKFIETNFDLVETGWYFRKCDLVDPFSRVKSRVVMCQTFSIVTLTTSESGLPRKNSITRRAHSSLVALKSLLSVGCDFRLIVK